MSTIPLLRPVLEKQGRSTPIADSSIGPAAVGETCFKGFHANSRNGRTARLNLRYSKIAAPFTGLGVTTIDVLPRATPSP